MTSKEIGKMLQEKRISAGISLEEAARQMEMTVEELEALEKGEGEFFDLLDQFGDEMQKAGVKEYTFVNDDKWVN